MYVAKSSAASATYPLALALLLLLWGPAGPAQEKTRLFTAEELGKKLATYDSAILSRVTVFGSVQSSSPSEPPAELNFTCAGRRCAVRQARSLRPQYTAPNMAGTKKGNVFYDDNGNEHLIFSDARLLHIFDEDKCAKMETAVEYVIAPDGKILTESDKTHHVVFYPPDDTTIILPKLYVQGALGRGFSALLKKVTDVKATNNKLLRVTGEGPSLLGPVPGKWLLLVDPELDFLVREASCFVPGRESARYTIKNGGLKVEQGLSYPAEGSLSFFGSYPLTYQVKFKSVKLESDETLYKSVAQVFAGPMPPETNIFDYRVAPRKYEYVGLERGESQDKPSDQPPEEHTGPIVATGSSRILLLILVNLAIVILFGIALWVRRFNRRLK